MTSDRNFTMSYQERKRLFCNSVQREKQSQIDALYAAKFVPSPYVQLDPGLDNLGGTGSGKDGKRKLMFDDWEDMYKNSQVINIGDCVRLDEDLPAGAASRGFASEDVDRHNSQSPEELQEAVAGIQ